MHIETDRLVLIPLSPDQHIKWLDNLQELENELNCKYLAEPMDDNFRKIIRGQFEKASADKDNFLFYCFWFIIRKSDRVVVGSADFKNPPDITGAVEIGYGLGGEFEHRGYMTEAVNGLCQWAKEQEKVSAVIAETYMDGIASQNVLKRCGFKQYKQEESLWWRLTLTNS